MPETFPFAPGKTHRDPAPDHEDAPAGNRIEVRAEIAPRVTFATHQCDIAVVVDLVVVNPGKTGLEDLTLHLAAEPPVLAARTWVIDRVGPETEFRPRDRRVTIAGGLLDGLTESMRATVRFELRQGEAVLAEAEYPILALARNEWGGGRYMPELIAAFVTPNDPAVQRLLKEASRILSSAGKSGALEGYQARSRSRSYEIVSGI